MTDFYAIVFRRGVAALFLPERVSTHAAEKQKENKNETDLKNLTFFPRVREKVFGWAGGKTGVRLSCCSLVAFFLISRLLLRKVAPPLWPVIFLVITKIKYLGKFGKIFYIFIQRAHFPPPLQKKESFPPLLWAVISWMKVNYTITRLFSLT